MFKVLVNWFSIENICFTVLHNVSNYLRLSWNIDNWLKILTFVQFIMTKFWCLLVLTIWLSVMQKCFNSYENCLQDMIVVAMFWSLSSQFWCLAIMMWDCTISFEKRCRLKPESNYTFSQNWLNTFQYIWSIVKTLNHSS